MKNYISKINNLKKKQMKKIFLSKKIFQNMKSLKMKKTKKYKKKMKELTH